MEQREERATLAGGSFEVESANGGGTRVLASFPLRWRSRELMQPAGAVTGLESPPA